MEYCRTSGLSEKSSVEGVLLFDPEELRGSRATSMFTRARLPDGLLPLPGSVALLGDRHAGLVEPVEHLGLVEPHPAGVEGLDWHRRREIGESRLLDLASHLIGDLRRDHRLQGLAIQIGPDHEEPEEREREGPDDPDRDDHLDQGEGCASESRPTSRIPSGFHVKTMCARNRPERPGFSPMILLLFGTSLRPPGSRSVGWSRDPMCDSTLWRARLRAAAFARRWKSHDRCLALSQNRYFGRVSSVSPFLRHLSDLDDRGYELCLGRRRGLPGIGSHRGGSKARGLGGGRDLRNGRGAARSRRRRSGTRPQSDRPTCRPGTSSRTSA